VEERQGVGAGCGCGEAGVAAAAGKGGAGVATAAAGEGRVVTCPGGWPFLYAPRKARVQTPPSEVS